MLLGGLLLDDLASRELISLEIVDTRQVSDDLWGAGREVSSLRLAVVGELPHSGEGVAVVGTGRGSRVLGKHLRSPPVVKLNLSEVLLSHASVQVPVLGQRCDGVLCRQVLVGNFLIRVDVPSLQPEWRAGLPDFRRLVGLLVTYPLLLVY